MSIKLFVVGLPALLAGTWLGLKLFGLLDEAAFRKVVLVLLLASGVVLRHLSTPRRGQIAARKIEFPRPEPILSYRIVLQAR